ncbi:hypothetical protein Brsp06_04955 [Brucella sp. NBRC 13694]|uniref:hypothetical protein n=1 Tax=Brucella/Ochrobactrum group TaxID=2826938 RepID=UPI000F68BF35|nr:MULTISPECIES: hypothetical protein [Brucella/Ochrobactrum group]MCQ9148382.1 hypothetical protein [Ochrobactrum sp. BTU2]MCR5943626.1 hypothetical protein [Ochrobactrum sp. XJ1]RRY15706.1 hypothetical protein EGJ57_24165 [Brucella anthropi]
MDRTSETYHASPFLDNLADDALNPIGSGPVAECSAPERTEYPVAVPLCFKPGVSLETAKSIHRYARIFGGASVKLIEDETCLMLVLMETRDRKLMLDQFSDFLT